MATNHQKIPRELNKLVCWLAETVYPDDEPGQARKRVRARIRYAAKIGKIKLIHERNKTFVEHPQFFTWAMTKWQVLTVTEGIPKEGWDGKASLDLPAFDCSSFGVNIPNDPNELRDAYVKAETERYRLQLENDRLRGMASELDQEVTRWREKYARISQKNRESGSKGGRGNSY